MLIIDANAILRYILCDNDDMATQVEELLENELTTARHEVLAEVVYVLNKVYKLPRLEIQRVVEQFLNLENIHTDDKAVVLFALTAFGQTTLDFVDTLLYAHHVVKGSRVFTFDKKLRTKMGLQ